MKVYCDDERFEDHINALYKKVKKLQTKVLKARIYRVYTLNHLGLEPSVSKNQRIDLETKLTKHRNELMALISDNAHHQEFELFL